MKKYGKAGLLIFTLVMPALVFVFLRYFGSNHYELPYYNPKLDAAGNIEMRGADTVFNKADAIDLFELSSTSKPGLTGRYTVINYIDSSEEDSIKLVVAQLDRIHTLARNIDMISIVSIIDSSEIGKWSGIKKVGWALVSGNSEEISNVLNRTLYLDRNLESIPAYAKLLLTDDKGYVRGYYDARQPEEIERLMAEIKILNYERGKGLEN